MLFSRLEAEKELVRIKIPNADENDHRPWQSFVLGVNQVHENQYGKGLWAKLLVGGHTTVSRPFPDGTDDKGRKIWKTEKREVSNRELKEMVEYYKTQSKEDRDPAPADRQAQKEEPEAEAEGDRQDGKLSVKDQLAAGKKEASKIKAHKKTNTEPEL